MNKCGKQNKLIKKLSTRLHESRKENKKLTKEVETLKKACSQSGSPNNVSRYNTKLWVDLW